MKKPDRFERLLDRHTGDEDDWTARMIPAARVVKLLRAEHAWMRRQLQDIAKVGLDEGLFKAGVDIVIEEVLYRLDQRRK